MGYRGSPEAARDPRGFAVQVLHRSGNWDLVGNNLPVFFIRDAIKFPISCTPQAVGHSPISKTRIWRSTSSPARPNRRNMLTYLYSNQGMPASYREMDGFGVHAFRLVNAQGQQISPNSTEDRAGNARPDPGTTADC